MEHEEFLKNDFKVYVDVIEKRFSDGTIIPVSITWEDGTEYDVTQVLDVRRAASLKAGGVGMRYKVRINGNITYMYLEESRWFVERRN